MTRRWIAMQMTAEAQAINKSALHAFRICSGRGLSVVAGSAEMVMRDLQATGARRISGRRSEVSYTKVEGECAFRAAVWRWSIYFCDTVISFIYEVLGGENVWIDG